jgi:ferredoxin-NADP reductase
MRRLHGGRSGSLRKISHRVALTAKMEIARGTWLFRFEKPEGFAYRAGQHVRMSLLRPGRKDPAGNYRFWSFASAPYESDLAFAVRMRESPFKSELAALPLGGMVQIEMLENPPHGAFALDDGIEPVVFLAGGIGVVPAFSMIKQALHEGCARNLTLIYSNRSREDAPFKDELTELARQYDCFVLVSTLTRADEFSEGERGRISLAMVKRYIPKLSTAAYYISGLKGMVESLHGVLITAGVAATAR